MTSVDLADRHAMRSDAMPVLTVRGLDVEFRTSQGVIRVVRGVDLSVATGEVVALVGESGSGKSTTARAIASLLPKPAGVITAGDIQVGLVDVRAARSSRKIAVVLQQALNAMNPTRKIGNQIAELRTFHCRIGRRQAAREAVDFLAMMGIPDPVRIARSYPFELSGGMRQRAVLAMALSCEPRLLIADEPTTALDVTTQAEILDLLGNVVREKDMSVLLITHDLGVVARLADFVYVMYGGMIVEEGPTATVFKHPSHPYTERLLKATPDISSAGSEAPEAIEGQPPDLAGPILGCPFVDRCHVAVSLCAEQVPVLSARELLDQRAACWVTSPSTPVLA